MKEIHVLQGANEQSTETFGGSEIAMAEKFNCKLCSSTTFQGAKPNDYARDYIQKTLSTKFLMITCDAHPTARVDYFCKRHSKLVCQGCLVTAHGDHLHDMVPLEKSCLDQYMQTAIKEMQDYRDRVQTLVDTCVKLNETDITVSALEFFSLTKIIEKLLGVGSGTS